MAQLSSAQSVLGKLSGVEQKLNDLYETVDHAKKVREGLDAVYDKQKENKAEMESTISEIGELKGNYQAGD